MSGIEIVNTRVEHLGACAELQRLCFPTLAPEERLTEAHIANHVRLFPEGQFVAVDAASGSVIGMTAGFRTHFDFEHTHGHTYLRAISNGWFWRHNPRGSYYYGADMSVHPDHRGKGIARKFHDARKALCRRMGLKGQVVCGMIPGYAELKHELTAHEYMRKVMDGALYDSTFSTQLRNGFVWRGMIANYVQDPPTDGWATLLEWRNPDYMDLRVPGGPLYSFYEELAAAARP